MKQVLFLILVLWGSFVNPRGSFFYAAATAGGGSCTTLQIDNSGTWDGGNLDGTTYVYRAGKFTTVGAITVCAADLNLFRTGSPSGTLEVKIYTDNSNNPGVLVGSGSSTINKTDVSTVADSYRNFTGISASLSAATVYWVVLQESAVDPDTSNRIRWFTKALGAGAGRASVAGLSWDNVSINFLFKLYSL